MDDVWVGVSQSGDFMVITHVGSTGVYKTVFCINRRSCQRCIPGYSPVCRYVIPPAHSDWPAGLDLASLQPCPTPKLHLENNPRMSTHMDRAIIIIIIIIMEHTKIAFASASPVNLNHLPLYCNLMQPQGSTAKTLIRTTILAAL